VKLYDSLSLLSQVILRILLIYFPLIGVNIEVAVRKSAAKFLCVIHALKSDFSASLKKMFFIIVCGRIFFPKSFKLLYL